jgi:hypothetical protein
MTNTTHGFFAPPTKERPNIEPGMHAARFYLLADLGTHEEEQRNDKGEDVVRSVHKVRFGWETPDATAVFDEAKGPQPFVLGQDYTLSMNEKANLRKMIEGFLGVKFKTQKEADLFDISTLIGRECMLNVTLVESKKGKTYPKVQGVTPLVRGIKVGAPYNEPVVYHTSAGKGGTFTKLPEWMQDQIKTSAELARLESDNG